MRDYEQEKKIAECIIAEARAYSENPEVEVLDSLESYYDDIEELNLTNEDKALYRARLDLILYTDQF